MPDNKKNSYTPPADMWKVNAELEFKKPLGVDDPRYIDTESGRGEFCFDRLYKSLGIDTKTSSLRSPKESSYNLFCGHIGCGKSTELRRVSKYLNQDSLFFVIFLDAVVDLETNNLQYPDVLLSLANKLLSELGKNNIKLAGVHIKNLDNWFAERIIKSEKLKELSTEVTSEIGLSGGIPFLCKVSALLTGKIKGQASYTDEIRRVVKNTFNEFAFALNQLISAAEDALKAQGKSGKLLFIIDGTDRISKEDSERLFVEEAGKLHQVNSNFIYCAPIYLLYKGNQAGQGFDQFILPMIKISHKDSDAPFKEGYDVLRQILYKRAAPQLFESEELVNRLIANSGGNPRDLLRLLKDAIIESDMERFHEADIEKAIHNLSMAFRRFLDTSDYDILYEIDQSSTYHHNSEKVRNLLLNLAILQYNNYWWKSHPAVRRLEEYKNKETPPDQRDH